MIVCTCNGDSSDGDGMETLVMVTVCSTFTERRLIVTCVWNGLRASQHSNLVMVTSRLFTGRVCTVSGNTHVWDYEVRLLFDKC